MAVILENALFLLDWRWLTTGLVFIIWYFLAQFYRKVSMYPKGPFPLPILGNLLTIRSQKQFYKKANEWATEYGDPFTLWMGQKPMVVLNSHDVVREAFIERRHEFAGRFPTKMAALQTQGDHDIMFEDYNPRWKVLRKVALTAVRKYAVSESLESLCCDVVDAYVDTLGEGPQVVDSRAPLMFILFNIIGISVYGAKFEKDSPDMIKLQNINRTFLEVAPNGIPSDIAPWLGVLYRSREKTMEKLIKDFLEIVDRLYNKAKAKYVPGIIKNFTHAMLAAKDEAIEQDKSDAQYLTEASMVQIVLDIFNAAADTSLGELQWLCLRMAKEPTIQAKIQKEIEENIGHAPPTIKDREKMPYTVACLLETLRYYPIVPFGLPHNTSTDTEAGGRKIPKDTGILYNIYSMNHDRNLWKDPEAFKPERFLDPATGRLRQDELPPLMTFGLGPRTCPGEKLAHIDMFYVLVRLMQRVSVSSPTNESGVDIRIWDSSLLLIPKTQNIVYTKRD